MNRRKSQTGSGVSSNTKMNSYQKRMSKTKKDALRILKANFGNVSMTCEQVGIARVTFYKWRSDDPDFDAEVEAINERTLDFVESKMMQGINEGNTRLIMFYLNCKGKKRGYGVKAETEGERSCGVTLHISPNEADY